MPQQTVNFLTYLQSLLPALMGAVISAMQIPNTVAGLSGILSAVTIGYIGGNALVEYLAIGEESWIAFFLRFNTGLFGLAILRESLSLLPEWMAQAGKKFFGGN